MMTNPMLAAVFLVAGALGCATSGCKSKQMSQRQICSKGCEFRLACIEELELDKAVTEANRAVTQKNQLKKHDGFLKFCVDACNQGPSKGRIPKRMRGYAACGVKAKTCSAFFRCAREVEQAGKQAKAGSQRK